MKYEYREIPYGNDNTIETVDITSICVRAGK